LAQYVVNSASDIVAIIDATSVTVDVGNSPTDIAVILDGSQVFVANSSGNTLTVIQTSDNTAIATIAVGDLPIGVAAGVIEGAVFVVVANNGSNTVSIIDGFNEYRVVQVGENSIGITTCDTGSDNFGEVVFVTNKDSNTISELEFVGANEFWSVIDTYDSGGDSPVAVPFPNSSIGLGEPEMEARATHAHWHQPKQRPPFLYIC